MWPTCINKLSPIEINLNQEIPEFLKETFNKKGIFNEDKMFIPVRIVKILGTCDTALYTDCPNIPENHLDLAMNDPDYYDFGLYHWFDFDILGIDGVSLPLRVVFNDGNADTNDGFWGVVWERNTEEIIANIISSGDMETTIGTISKKHIDMYESQEILIPTIFENTDNGLISDNIIVANEKNLEKFIRFAIQVYYEFLSWV
ncbi:MAG: hypothetical protein WBA93_32910 [Microcoleaceae cyanobacterium]